MKRTLFVTLIICLLVIPARRIGAIDCWDKGQRVRQETSDCRYCIDPELLKYCIVKYDFEVMNWQGWTRFDNTDPGLFWHVDGYAGSTLGAAPVPLSGTQSGWCGGGSIAVPITDWKTPSGYANNWDQIFSSDDIVIVTADNLTLDYVMYIDCEMNNDYMVVELLDVVNASCTIIDGPYTGTLYLAPAVNFTVLPGTYRIRFRFISDCECSDENGCYNSDGGVHIDEINLVNSLGLIDYENFEAALPGARNVDSDANGIWWRASNNRYGMYSGLLTGLLEKDPCNDDFSTQVMFFLGSPYTSGSYPGLFDTPFCPSSSCQPDPCQNEMIISPVIDLTRYSSYCDESQDMLIPPGNLAILGGAALEFQVYRDLSLSSLVFYYWKMRKVDSTGIPLEPWRDRGFLYYHGRDHHGPFCCSEKDFLVSRHRFGDMFANEYVQVALGIVDMRRAFFPTYGSGLAHTPTPYFDDVKITRFKAEGPRFHYRSIDLFQDAFPEPDAGFVRADAAIDIDPIGAPTINPRDCIRITCDSPNGGGLAYDAGGPRVYIHVRVLWIGPGWMPNLVGPSLQGNCGTYVSNDPLWTVIQADSCLCACPNWYAEDIYEFDLNDQLFTPGYMIEYYFRAVDNAGNYGFLPANASTLPDHPGTYYGRSNWFEFTCLPTGDSDILYVDDFHDRLSQDGEVHDNFDDAFMAVLPLENQPDRYDVNGPSSMVSNSLASRASLDDLLFNYRTIIWDSGNLRNGTICDGTTGDKSEDCQLLHSWIDNSQMEPGLWILGDNVAWDLTAQAMSPDAGALMNLNCGVQLRWDSYYEISNVEKPMVGTVVGGIFYSLINPFCVYGSCPIINAFDCIDITTGSYSLEYPTISGTPYYAAIHNQYVNYAGADAKTIWFGFSYMYTRGCEIVPQARFLLVADAMNFFLQPINMSITGEEEELPVYRTMLSQNYPNPFNPVTMIDYSLREQSPVTLRIYDVSGRLVRTLVDGIKAAGPHKECWDGMNGLGKTVASGIYFYRMDASGFSETKKMILLR